MSKRLLILQCGSVMSEVIAKHGDFGEWFTRAMAGQGLEFHVTDAMAALLPEPLEFKGILITGSLASAYSDEPWILRLAGWIRRHALGGVPVLGVCFGHQILARAIGGRVRRMPGGMELGTREVRLTEAGKKDWLFNDVPDALACQQTHNDEVEIPPPDATVLAVNGHCPVQAFGLGRHIRGVQFHPEINAAVMRSCLECGIRAGWAAQAHVDTIGETPSAAKILLNFAAAVRKVD